jgi:hypothetical protein
MTEPDVESLLLVPDPVPAPVDDSAEPDDAGGDE